MSLHEVAWLLMQGFTAKYYFRKAGNGDFAVNRPAPTLQAGMAWHIPSRHDSYLPPGNRHADTGIPYKEKLKAVKEVAPSGMKSGNAFIIKGLSTGSAIKG